MTDEDAARARVKSLIAEAFADVERPGNWALRDSWEGDEPFLVERAFADKNDWRTLDPEFLDTAPDGLASALSFMSDEAFRYFLPAYLFADLDDALDRVSPVFHLCSGLSEPERSQKVNPRRYGDRTAGDARRYRLSVFTPRQAAAILAYLEYKAARDEFSRKPIDRAIADYWRGRAAQAPPSSQPSPQP